VVREVSTYVLRDMTSPEGAFYSAEDADCEREEGKVDIWSTEEIQEILGTEQGRLYCTLSEITTEGNFQGKNIPNLIDTSLDSKAAELNINAGELRSLIEECRIKLYHQREERVHPYKDDKILTAWNALMIAAMARAAAVLGERKYADVA